MDGIFEQTIALIKSLFVSPGDTNTITIPRYEIRRPPGLTRSGAVKRELPPKIVVVSPKFKLVFWAVVGFTLLGGIAQFAIAAMDQPKS